MYMYIRTCAYAHMYVHMHIYMCMCIYTHAYIGGSLRGPLKECVILDLCYNTFHAVVLTKRRGLGS